MFERPAGGERCLVAHVKLRDPRHTTDFAEFCELAASAGAEVISKVICPRASLDPKYLIGTGKLAEIAELVKLHDIELVLFNHSLSPSQERNLEKYLKCRVLDRVGLILDIFALRARTFEGKLQVELAQLTHLASRLVRGWTHLERQKGGIGLRGPGETQLESDKRMLGSRINTIKDKLKKVRSQRSQGRRLRQRQLVPTVALVGYTNVGKSTLFNALTSAGVYVRDQLFATLDTTLRSVKLPHVGDVILADTVGFIRDLPHELVDAFRATLEEVSDADLILHVIDASSIDWESNKRQVEAVLATIGAMHVPILEVYNKIDLLPDMEPQVVIEHDAIIRRVRVSAKRTLGLEGLQTAIVKRLSHDIIKGELVLSPDCAKERSALFDLGAVDHEEHLATGDIKLDITLPKVKWSKLCQKFSQLEDLIKVGDK